MNASDRSSAASVEKGRLVVDIGYDPLVDDLGDDTGEGSIPTVSPDVVVDIYDPTQPGLGDDTGRPGGPTLPRGVTVAVGYDPLVDDLGDDTGEGSLPGIPQGVVINIYDPTQPGLGDDTGPLSTRRALRVVISAELLRQAFA